MSCTKKTGELILTLCTALNDVFLRKHLPFGVVMIAPALNFLVALIFLIVVNSLAHLLTRYIDSPNFYIVVGSVATKASQTVPECAGYVAVLSLTFIVVLICFTVRVSLSYLSSEE